MSKIEKRHFLTPRAEVFWKELGALDDETLISSLFHALVTPGPRAMQIEDEQLRTLWELERAIRIDHEGQKVYDVVPVINRHIGDILRGGQARGTGKWKTVGEIRQISKDEMLEELSPGEAGEMMLSLIYQACNNLPLDESES